LLGKHELQSGDHQHGSQRPAYAVVLEVPGSELRSDQGSHARRQRPKREGVGEVAHAGDVPGHPSYGVVGADADREFALDTSTKVVLYSDQKSLMYAGATRKEDPVHDYFVQEMVRIRIGELRAEASRARAAREARESQGWGHYLGILGVAGTTRAEGGGYSRGTVEEACCA
jgi:hypothetical protein